MKKGPERSSSLLDFFKAPTASQEEEVEKPTPAFNVPATPSPRDGVPAYTPRRVNRVKASEQRTELKNRASLGRAPDTSPGLKSDARSGAKSAIFEEEEDEFDDSTPAWALPENLLDAQLRPPAHPDYDPTTLHVPPEALKTLSPGMRQYWLQKAKHFDKVIFFKLGKFYELFYEDASIGVRHLDLNFMGRKQHSGFPEAALEKNLGRMVALGFKVAIVEQIETEPELRARLAASRVPKEQRIIKRELVSVATRGTYIGVDRAESAFSFLWSICARGEGIDLALANVERCELFGAVAERPQEILKLIKDCLLRYPPSEVVLQGSGVGEKLQSILLESPSRPSISFLSVNRVHRAETAQALLSITPQLGNSRAALNLLGYLDDCLLLERFVAHCAFGRLDTEGAQMKLDPQTVFNLNLLPLPEQPDSLLTLLDHCVSPMGKRLLRDWVLAPLTDRGKVLERQSALRELERHAEVRTQLLSSIEHLQDIEKTCHALYKHAVPSKIRVILFSDVSSKQLRELKDLLRRLETAHRALRPLAELNGLQALALCGADVASACADILGLINWTGETPQPYSGSDPLFDAAEESILNIRREAEKVGELYREKLGSAAVSIVACKFRFELEVPDKIVHLNGKPEGFEFSSKRTGYERFVNSCLLELQDRLWMAEDERKEALIAFNLHVFSALAEKRELWGHICEAVAEIDALCALSLFSFDRRYALNFPILVEGVGPTYLHAEELKHPLLAAENLGFVGNAISFDESNAMKILTGPNMGGKSTLMRSLGLNVILAQLGAAVFASDFRLAIVDRVFTRIGASDRLEERKSTFYIEMEETLTILGHATPSSLLLIDELGRGTSTFDGYAIAASTLRFLVAHFQARTLFATHYFFLRHTVSDLGNVVFVKMGHTVHCNEGQERVEFSYKLEPGMAEKSFAFNVALTAGVPRSLVERAEEISNSYRAHSDL